MSELSDFLLTTGRTLSQMALYSPDHPTVKGAVEKSYRHLVAVLNESEEVSLSLSEGKLLINGKEPEDVVESALKPFSHLLETFDLHSLSFLPGIDSKEMIPFFLLAYRNDLKKQHTDVAVFLKKEHADHIKVNQAKYAKIGEGESVGVGQGAGAGPGPGGGINADTAFRKELESLPLDKFLTQLIARAVNDPNEQQMIFDRVISLLKNQIQPLVDRQTKIIRQQKDIAINERQRPTNA